MGSVLTVEEVSGGKALSRFVELPHVLAGGEPRFASLVLGWERTRLDPHRASIFERGDGRYFMVRRRGRPVGRITAHIAEPDGPGCFGFWWVDDDADVARMLVDAAEEWLASEGCASMTGPVSFTPDQEEGLLVEGYGVPGVTGRAWHPPHLSELLRELGFTEVARRSTWRLSAADLGVELPVVDDAPGHAGAYGDPRLVLDGVAAVPDLSEVLRRPRLRGALAVARRARVGDWDTATIVRCDVEPEVAVPAIQTAAARAGYQTVIAPWSPEPTPPETTHATFTLTW